MTTQALQDSILFQTGDLVNGIWKTLDTTFDVLNPATGEVVAKVAKAGKAETEEAIAAATKAFPAWRAKTAKERSPTARRFCGACMRSGSAIGRNGIWHCVRRKIRRAAPKTAEGSGRRWKMRRMSGSSGGCCEASAFCPPRRGPER